MARLSLSSLRIRLLLLALLAVGPPLALLVYSALEQRQQHTADALETALRLARIASFEQQRLTEGARQFLAALAEFPAVRRGDWALCSRLVADLMRRNPRYANVGATTPAGEVACSALPMTGPVNVSDRAYFRRAVETRGFAVGDYQVGRLTGRPTLNFGYPVLDQAGRVQSVVFAALDLAWLSQLARDAPLPRGSLVTVTDRNGTILARHPDPGTWVGKGAAEAAVVKAILARREGTVEARGVDGVARFYGFVPLGGAARAEGPYVSIGIPKDAALAPAHRTLARNLAALGLVAALAFAGAWVGGEAFVLRRVRALMRATGRLAAGELGARVGVEGGAGELGELARSFDTMAEALERLTRRNELLLSAAGEGICGQDPEGRITFANPAAARLLGWGTEELVGRLQHPLLHHSRPDGTAYPREECPIHAAIAGGAVHHVDSEVFWRKDGTRFPVEYVSTPIREAGRVVGAVVVFRDVTERKQAEEALRRARDELETRVQARTAELREANALLQAILDNSTAVIYVKDPEGRYLLINRRFEDLFHVTRDQAVGKTDHDLFPKEAADRFRAADRAVLAGGSAAVVEETAPQDDGVHTYVSVKFPLRDAGGAPSAVCGISTDITDRKQAEQAAVLAKEDAEQANRAKSDFLSRMSHELRTPLNVILGFAQLLEMTERRADDQESVQQILKAGRHLLELINEVLDIARIEAGRMSISPEPIRVGTAVGRVLDLARPLAAARLVDLRPEGMEHFGRYILADSHRLQQVLLNLVSNGIKYNREGGRLTVRCEEAGAGRLRIRVADTGPGIPPALMARLFTPFDRLGAEAHAEEGTGLGLALSKRLVELMQGAIGVESVEGEGSTFWVELAEVDEPAAQREPAGEEHAAPAALIAPGGTVLYIEDNLSNVRLIERVVAQRPGVRLLSAMQGRLGIELARLHRPDLILLDLHLPDVSGEDVLRELGGDRALRGTPVIVLSADATPRQIERLRLAGAQAYLTKPLDVHQLLPLMDEMLSRERMRGGPGREPAAPEGGGP